MAFEALKLTDFITAAGKTAYDRLVADSAGRLALTGISVGYKVMQYNDNKIYELMALPASTSGNWTDRSSIADCTSAIQACIDALPVGGQIILPNGGFQQWGNVVKNGSSQSNEFVFTGTGNSKWHFLNPTSSGFQRVQMGNHHAWIAERVKFFGDNTTRYDAADSVLYLPNKYVELFGCSMYGACTNSTHGVIFSNGQFRAVRIDLSGSAADIAGVITLLGYSDGIIEQAFAADYCESDFIGLNAKNNTGNFAWIYAKHGYKYDGSTVQDQANVASRLIVRGATPLDEGSQVGIYAENLRWFEAEGINNTVSANYGICYCKDVEVANLKDSFCGWGTTRHVIARFENCKEVNIDGLENQTNTYRILELAGTTKKLNIKNSKLLGTATYPDGINNSAGAVIEWGGVKKNSAGKVDYF